MSGFDLPLPSSPEHESWVLGAALSLEGQIGLLSGILRPDDFALTKNQIIFRRLLELDGKGKPLDVLTLAAALTDTKEFDAVGGYSGIADLLKGIPKGAPVEEWAKRVKDCSIKRRIVHVAFTQAHEAAYGGAEASDLVAKASRAFSDIERECAPEADSFTFPELLERIGVDAYLKPPKGMSLNTSIPALNRLLPSLTGGEILVVGARTNSGKSAFIEQTVIHVARKHDVLYHNLEMKGVQLMDRAVSQVGGPDSERMRLRYQDGQQYELNAVEGRAAIGSISRIGEATGGRLRVSYNPRINTVPALRQFIRAEQSRRKLRLVIIDHLGYMRPVTAARSSYEGTSDVIRELHLMAGLLNVTLLIAVQLNRASDNEKRPPRISDLRDSGVIEEEADCILLLHRLDENDALSDVGETQIIMAKNRLGPTGVVRTVFRRKALLFGEEVLPEEEREGRFTYVP